MTGLRIRWRREASSISSSATADAGVSASLLPWVAAAGIILLALLARAYNVNWDDTSHLHPDERHLTIVTIDVQLPGSVGEYFDTDRSSLNPYNRPDGGSFVYGTLPLFITKYIAVATGQDNYDDAVLVGRYLSALFDAGTVLFVFLIGRRLFSPAAGLVGALLYAAAPLAIQHAHFYVVDPHLTFFTTAYLHFCVRLWQAGRPVDAALAGLMLGLGGACKITAVVVSPLVLVAAAWHLLPVMRGTGAKTSILKSFRAPLLSLFLAVFVAVLAFRIAQPYAFQSPSLPNPLALNQRWVDDQETQSKLLGGTALFPPSVQWIGRASYLYPLSEMVRWGMGPAFGIAGWLAVAYAGWRVLWRQDWRHVLPLLFVLLYFGFMGRQFTLYLRYFLPLYPVLAVLAGYALVEVLNAGSALAQRRRDPRLQRLAYGGVGLVLLASLLAGVAYLSIYTQPVTRVEASRWIHQSLPNNATIGIEHWDEAVPIGVRDVPPRTFTFAELKLYDIDTEAKVAELIDVLSRSDYLTISSNRLMNSIPRNGVNYPVSSRYYSLLLDGELGFRLMREFTSYPRLGPLQFADHGAQESLSSYDHPRVLVFEKTREFSRARLEQQLGRGPFATFAATPKQADRNALLLKPADLRTQQSNGTWTSVFSDSGLAKSAPTLLWLVALQAASLVALPVVFLICRRLPDRGYLLAKPMGLLFVAYPVWLLASLKVVHFDQTSALVSLLLLMSAGFALTYRLRDEVAAFLRDNWRLFLVCELVFLLAFFAFREIRMANPDLWHPYRGGEKPMDLAYLTAVARSTTMPPYDPWFAGGYINYYYFGQYLTATLLKLTTIPPEVAFNLAVPTFFAMTVGCAFSVAYNLAAAARSLIRRTAGHVSIPGWSTYACGLLGALFVAVVGNLDAVDQLFDRLAAVSSVDPDLPFIGPLVAGVSGLWQVVVNGKELVALDYWRSSRMMPPTNAITEFPFFSFLFADLHAHMMAIPFEVMTLGLCLSLALTRRGDETAWRQWALVAVLGLVVGSLRWINSWDYPPFLLLSIAAIAISERHLTGGSAAATLRLGWKVLVLGVLSFLLFKPFLDGYQTPVAGLHATPETTQVQHYLAHFGAFLVPALGWLAFLLWRAMRASPLLRGYGRGSAMWVWAASALVFIVPLAMLWCVLTSRPLIALLLPVLTAVAYLALREARLRRPDGGLRLFLLSLLGLGLGLSIGVDLVTLDGDIERMNTVFKFYMHVWLAFAIVAAFAVWQLVFAWRPGFGHASILAFGHPVKLSGLSRAAGLAAMTLLLLGTLVYTAGTISPRTSERFAQLPAALDGMEYMRTAVYSDPQRNTPLQLGADYEGIQWLRRNVQGTPAIVEGRAPLYRWGGRFSIYTGLPTVLGWDWHQTQQRGDLAVMVDQRGQAVDRFYSDPDIGQAQRFLRQYGVQYVILGELERVYYAPSGLFKFIDGHLGNTLELAFENDQLRIYRVVPEQLWAAR